MPASNPLRELEKAATTAAIAQVQRATTIQQAVTIINVLGSIGNPGAAMGPQRVSLAHGMAAGGVASPWNGWMNYSRGQVANTFSLTSFDGNVDNWVGGIDYGVSGNLVVGASVGYDRTSIATRFNNGNIAGNGLMLAPYASYQLSKMFSVDAVFGYAEGESDVSRNFRAITGKQNFTRNFGAINLSAIHWTDSWQVTGKFSYISAEEKLKDFTDSASLTTQGQNNRLSQIRFGAQVGYWAEGIMPYIGLTYVNDVSAPSSVIPGASNTHEAYSIAAGVNMFSKNLISNLSYTTERGRSQSKNDVFMGSVGYRF